MKILTVVGARPQFIKAAPVSNALHNARHTEYIVHTGQHYDYGMSQVFFDELQIPEPNINLAVGSGSHGQQTGQMLIQLEEVIQAQKPNWVLVYGDTNSTLAGALAATKLHVPIAHVEAGLRSFNRAMPEEINRVLTDHISALLLCPSQTAVNNLAAEGVTKGVHMVGDVMYDAVLKFSKLAKANSNILSKLNLQPQTYLLATVHRPENTDHSDHMRSILTAFGEIQETIIFPVHPRTRKVLEKLERIPEIPNVKLIEPLGYLDMLQLQQHARAILTDSGGIQKEAYWLGVPCVTLRDETEWVETVKVGWNAVVGTQTESILQAIHSFTFLSLTSLRPPLYGDGHTTEHIINLFG